MNKAKDFQIETAKRIIEIFRNGKHKRVLLSDEVGLGKTIVARTIVDRAKDLPGVWDDGIYWVVYVCSNQNIIRQNTRNLGFSEEEIMKFEDSRLSMQHLLLEERKKMIRQSNYASPKQLIPLTPATSFRKTGGVGLSTERALIFAILKEMEEFKYQKKNLSLALKTTGLKSSSWKDAVDRYISRVSNCGDKYLNNMHNELRQNTIFNENLPYIIEKLDDPKNFPSKYINQLRVAFSLISLKLLKPDLVIMDEFQRFSDLLTTNHDYDTEERMIAHEFFASEHPYILLMSATPYKPFTTLEELNSDNIDEQYEDFLKLMDFLFQGEKSERSFNKIWEDYSNKLSHISNDTYDILVASKKVAEDKMYDVTCRTERLRESLIKEIPLEKMEITEGDILSYCQMQELLQEAKKVLCGKKNIGVNPSYNIPIEYVKSSPFLLSFMQNYQEGKTINAAFAGKEIPVVTRSRTQRLLLKANHIYRYEKLQTGNARLEALQTMLFKNHAERLLWVPASHPYYTIPQNHVFSMNKEFSKVLVFSAWEMVPRMLSIMLSYESERRNIGTAYKNRGITYKTREKVIGMNRLQEEGGDLLEYPSSYLADKYDYKQYFGKDINHIIRQIEDSIQKDIYELDMRENRVTSANNLLKLIKRLQGEEVDIDGVPKNAANTLAYMAIGSPAVCLLRVVRETQIPHGEEDKYFNEMTQDMASSIVAIFNRRESSAIVELTSPKDLKYYEQVLQYCVMGNLQSVLDEYCHIIDEEGSAKEFVEKMSNTFIPSNTYDIETTDSYCREDVRKMPMRRGFAYDYAKLVAEKGVKRNGTLQQAFNSPFRPFLLASTSVGQEGLDFHWYARKIVHWNLPSNPVNMEQREGRVNRYKCLAIRRNIAKLFGDKFTWKEMFDEANRKWHYELDNDYSEMVPYWCLPKEIIARHADDLEYIERILPLYPMSIDETHYKHLIDVLSLYRLTMGQPRQEELLNLLDGKVSLEQMNELLFNLSPYNHKIKK